MGYDVHITRAAHWTDSESVPITLPEWRAYLASDPEMRLDNFAEAKVEGDILRYENEGLAVWTDYSRHGEGGNMAWFDYRPGEVVVKNPDKEILAKMRQIAGSLGARVMGDEGELY
jgi:prepilin-type processing-associated H-X9-DG protein